ncbi:INCREASED PETAL GROWTH ANISOTROPY 1-like protein 1 isoform X2 [Daucus carota subsp. sativus]|uniref:INCREASED PETAL GROWTH ANISOTROPY 1-like protein 1 isoform X2 n=1 Tax=Daucus carota subsp. sativus TaxID=79200 RepID=UPI0007EF1EE7|nr:PREDICTED: protein CHUP1, chloroplastic isoform X2 [Daucus carota subsp. sativus]
MPLNRSSGEESMRIAFLKKEFEASLLRIHSLENENQELKQEVARLKAQVHTLKAHDSERKSVLWKKLQNSLDVKVPEKSQQKPSFSVEVPERSQVFQKFSPKDDLADAAVKKEIPAIRVAIPPPPRPVTSSLKQLHGNIGQLSPPPPPPPPSKALVGSKAVRRVPEVMEFYRSLMRRDSHVDNKSSPIGFLQVVNSRNMIGEIENKSTYLSAIKSDVEMQGGLINNLTGEVETASFNKISDVEAFVKWLDEELSCLVDERAVLKHFPQWPEKKADALREAAFSYGDLKNLHTEVLSFKSNPKQPLTQSLKKIQALQDRLEQSVSNIEKCREGTSKRYREFHIPWEWMLDSGLIGQMKLSSLVLAKEYMKRVARQLQSSEPSSQDGDFLIQGVRFAFRVHQVVSIPIL